MDRGRGNSFGRRLTCASTSLIPPTADANPLAGRQRRSADEEGVTGQGQTKDRLEALGFIICRLDELRQMVGFHGLETLGCLLDVTFTESCGAIRRERASTRAKETIR